MFAIRLFALPGSVREMVLPDLALGQKLTVLKRRCARPRLRRADRLFWLCPSQDLEELPRRVLIIVRPETVVSWYREGLSSSGLDREGSAVVVQKPVPSWYVPEYYLCWTLRIGVENGPYVK
jgi:hypothetical protein